MLNALDIDTALPYDSFVPEISRFYGIVITMYFRQSEHGVPHFHARYGETAGVFSIEPLRMLGGDLPRRAQRFVIEWATQHRAELAANWASLSTDGTLTKIAPLE